MAARVTPNTQIPPNLYFWVTVLIVFEIYWWYLFITGVKGICMVGVTRAAISVT